MKGSWILLLDDSDFVHNNGKWVKCEGSIEGGCSIISF